MLQLKSLIQESSKEKQKMTQEIKVYNNYQPAKL